jgi:glycosyltransferase involved in cell wall biosynthesis
MIVKNEEKVLARCLDSIRGFVDEIIIVDTGSDDDTKRIARKYTDKVYDFEWIDDFAAARNYSFSKATMQYCMWMDADDVILDSDREKLAELKASVTPDTDIIMMKYNTAFDEDGKPTFSYYRERIVRNNGKNIWQGRVHEAIARYGITLYTEAAVTHKKLEASYSDRNLKIYEKQLADKEPLSPRDTFYYGRELYYHNRIEDAVAILNGFVYSGEGWVENSIEACRILSLCYYSLNNREEALYALLKSMRFDTPRAEICCDIGSHFMHEGSYKNAAFWYELALTRRRNDASGAFVSPDCYGYLPCIQLCVCHDKMGNSRLAYEYNEMAGEYKPYSEAYRLNKEYFTKKGIG